MHLVVDVRTGPQVQRRPDCQRDGDEHARLAYGVTVHRLVGYIGAYWARLGRLDTLTFTAGVGENAARLRDDVMAAFADWGVEAAGEPVDLGDGAWRISAESSSVTVLVVPTDEELQIARACAELLD